MIPAESLKGTIQAVDNAIAVIDNAEMPESGKWMRVGLALLMAKTSLGLIRDDLETPPDRPTANEE